MPTDTATDETPADAPQEGQPEQQEEAFDAERAKAKIAKANAEAKSLRERLRKAEEAEAKLAEIENANKSETEKMQERLKAAEDALEKANRESMRAKVAADKKLPPALADRLRGDSIEEMEADADTLLADLQQQYVAKSAPAPSETGAGVTGKPAQDVASMSPAEMVKATRERRGR